MKPIVIHRQAKAELAEAVGYYEQRKPGLGQDFLAVVERAVLQIQRNPQLGAPYKSTKFRHYVVRRFPYVVFYVDLDEAMWVIAVAHAKRRPDYWRRRRIQ